jgi:HEAT repeat protein
MCWSEIADTEIRCPACGFELIQDKALTFEEKLLRTIEHPVPEKRYLAIQILGELGSQAALPGLEKVLDTEINDIYALRETLVALSKIQSPRSLEMLQKASHHPYHLIRQLAERLLDERDQRSPSPCEGKGAKDCG